MTYIVNPADPASPLDSYDVAQGAEEFRALKQYIQNLFGVGGGTKNKIIGGDFDNNPWQRGTSFALASGIAICTADRFLGYNLSSAGTITIKKISDAVSLALTAISGEKTSSHLEVEVTVLDGAIGAGEFVILRQVVEGFDWKQLAQFNCVLSFYHCHSKVGIYTIGVGNSGGDRSLTGEYSQLVANTWELAEIVLTASPTAGTWNYGNGVGATIDFNIAVGATYQTPKDIWTIGNFLGTANQVNGMDTAGNKFRFQYVQLEAGVSKTGFERRSKQQELALCQRYFEKSYNQGVTPGTGGVGGYTFSAGLAAIASNFQHTYVPFKVNKRAAPISSTYSYAAGTNNMTSDSSGVDLAAGSGTPVGSNETGFIITNGSGGGIAPAFGGLITHWTADAEF